MPPKPKKQPEMPLTLKAIDEAMEGLCHNCWEARVILRKGFFEIICDVTKETIRAGRDEKQILPITECEHYRPKI